MTVSLKTSRVKSRVIDHLTTVMLLKAERAARTAYEATRLHISTSDF